MRLGRAKCPRMWEMRGGLPPQSPASASEHVVRTPLLAGASLHQHPGSFALFRQEVLRCASVGDRGMCHQLPASLKHLSFFILFLPKSAWEEDVPMSVSCPSLDMDALSGDLGSRDTIGVPWTPSPSRL